jgi:hypothetical protein
VFLLGTGQVRGQLLDNVPAAPQLSLLVLEAALMPVQGCLQPLGLLLHLEQALVQLGLPL